MASLLNRPLAIHEQNSIAGLANRVLAQDRRQGARWFPDAVRELAAVEWTGNPVRADIAALADPETRFGSRAGALRLPVLGGSRAPGAQ